MKKTYKVYVKQYVMKTIEAEDLAEVQDWMSSAKWEDYTFISEGHTIYDEDADQIVEEVEAE